MQETLERKSIKNIDFNCDLAQAYGVYKNNQEFEKTRVFHVYRSRI